MSMQNIFKPLRRLRIGPLKQKLYVSYQHSKDHRYFSTFQRQFGRDFELYNDVSVQRERDTDRKNIPEAYRSKYLDREIVEDYVAHSSLMVVLCGTETWMRKYIDWEIHAALDHKLPLLGIVLPTQPRNDENKYYWPERLFDNLKSGYATWLHWTEERDELERALDRAQQKATEHADKLDNSREIMPANRVPKKKRRSRSSEEREGTPIARDDSSEERGHSHDDRTEPTAGNTSTT